MPFRLTTQKNSNLYQRAVRVFERIDMHGGDKTVCWEWKGYVHNAPIIRIKNVSYQVNRIVYALRKGIAYSHAPKLTWTCGNDYCCNPDHIVPERGLRVVPLSSKQRPSRDT